MAACGSRCGTDGLWSVTARTAGWIAVWRCPRSRRAAARSAGRTSTSFSSPRPRRASRRAVGRTSPTPGACSSAGPACEAGQRIASRADPMAMRLTLGHIEGLDDTIAAFAQQLGLTSVQFHTPSDLAGEHGYWAVDELLDLRGRCERAGLVVEGIENVRVFLEAVLPVAEEVGLRLAVHPDDPPTDIPLGGISRILASPEGLERAYELSGGSPAWGLDLCLGTVSEMAGQESVNRVIDFFGPKGRISYVHFRDVQGVVPRFQESFLGEGNYDPAAVLRRLASVGFDGFIIDDHVPAMVGDVDTWADTATAAYCSRGRAYAIGYLQGLLKALELGS